MIITIIIYFIASRIPPGQGCCCKGAKEGIHKKQHNEQRKKQQWERDTAITSYAALNSKDNAIQLKDIIKCNGGSGTCRQARRPRAWYGIENWYDTCLCHGRCGDDLKIR